MTPPRQAIDDATLATIANSLVAIADALVLCSSSRSLISRLEELLAASGALPARLYLCDARSGVFYPAAAFGCEETDAEIPVDEGVDMSGGDRVVLSRGRDLVGLLLYPPAADRTGMELLAAVLGPVLVNVHIQERSVEERRRLHNRIDHLVAAGRLLRHLDIERLLVEILQCAMEAVDAQVGAVLTGGEDRPQCIRVTMGLQAEHIDAIREPDGDRVVDVVARSGELLCLDRSQIADQLDITSLRAVLTGLLVLPLDSGRDRQGVVLLANPGSRFDEDSAQLAETVCQMAAIALENALLVQSRVEQERLRRELDIARSVQADMFPNAPLAVGGLRAIGSVRSCDETGGDYLTYLERDGRLVTMIGDVTGHGLGAALFTTAAHAIVQQQLRSDQELDAAIRALNIGLRSTHSGRFMTTAVIEFDPAASTFRMVSAGHNPVLWINRGVVRWLESMTLPLGILDDLTLQDPARLQPQAYAPGDCFVLYTDGFTEAFDPQGHCMGEEQFAAAVQQGIADGLDPAALTERLFAVVDEWTGGSPPTDDLTLLIVSVPEGPDDDPPAAAL
ncbi:MAG: PP2C family protein-serine/threonine phosphatase [Planctomycetota bacterium]